MIIECENTEDDILAFNYYHFEHSPAARRDQYLMRYVIPITASVVLTLISGFYELVLWSTVFWLGVLLVWILLFPKLYWWVLERQLRSFLREGQNRMMIGKRVFSLEADSVVETTESGQSKTKWNAVEKIVKNEDCIFIYNSSVTAYVVPRRAFESEDEFNRFFETAGKFKAQSATTT
ncbi:YcxB family protein [Desulfomonile tiedjei]|uniref:YcxB-like C-terminal domain-containing protein n=1 Tax=Desulfomonile tiedjei (strain ATCC 49306 / DSM 6799 / DCB-1) TaxID=706587 RepID=I4C383_DESTA|nr:YcxB family protein [Desulfomonile tiedjei]AFM24024.1 hypothetical protein Desti_1311 [Desulfomonile tiedjei DSM 6799]